MSSCLHCSGTTFSLVPSFVNQGTSSNSSRKCVRVHRNRSPRCQIQTEQAESQKSSSPDSEARTSVPGVRHTVWEQKKLAVPSRPKLTQSIHADVVVVGAGICGITTAYNLAKAGQKVVVLESRAIGSGQTGKTTAHLMPWLDDYYSELEKMVDQEKFKLVADAQRGAIDWLEKVIQEEGIDCNFKRIPGYLVQHEENEETAFKIRQEYESSKRAGFEDVKLENLNHDPKNGNFGVALVFPNAGEFQPLLYLKGLAEAFEKLGGQIFEQTLVVEQQATKVTTSTGDVVNAKAVVLATNSPMNKNLAIHAKQYARRSYVVGLKVPKGAISRASWWDTASPYHYVRLEDKEDYEVLVVGGEDHKVGINPDEYHDRYEKLEQWARLHWPAAEELIYKWSGQVYLPVDFLHLHGRDPLNTNNVYVATGDSGQGMTGGTIAGIVISSLITGEPHKWSKIYDPSRLPPPSLTTAEEFLQEVGENVEGYKDLLPFQGANKISVSSVAVNEGAIVQEDLNKYAVYRDGSGTVHRYSAVCPHLGCAVKWNPIDKTFDCPCHGSQFDTRGVVVNGPASTDLTPISYN